MKFFNWNGTTEYITSDQYKEDEKNFTLILSIDEYIKSFTMFFVNNYIEGC